MTTIVQMKNFYPLFSVLSAFIFGACRNPASVEHIEMSAMSVSAKPGDSQSTDDTSVGRDALQNKGDERTSSVAARIASATFRPVEPGSRRATAAAVSPKSAGATSEPTPGKAFRWAATSKISTR